MQTILDQRKNTMKYYGATHSTEKYNFGEIIAVFEVPADWDGYRFHGYCWCPEDLIPEE